MNLSTVSASDEGTTEALEKKLDSEFSNFFFDADPYFWFIILIPELDRMLVDLRGTFYCFDDFIDSGGKLVEIWDSEISESDKWL